ncbi:hypothetical protein GJ744_001899 [Endocarpon pusillum]|uniref:Uncharacterized protein n=1 Tax=Endocarpon pusillum TaxID=364733 RepID=A0A8H7ASP4_9EURO|nr:hypothetical protein GJ744_001899 [Endocarpon pusillum]
MLLGWLRGLQWTSSCGALITVAALIVDPFAQQVLSTYDCRVPDHAVVAKIPRTNVYNETVHETGANRGSITLELQNSIDGGIFNPGRNVAFECPTGNCTFPDKYHTVGFCSRCIDTTNNLSIQPKLSARNNTAWAINLPPNDASNLSAVISSSAPTGEGSDYLLMESTSGKTDIIVGYLPTNTSAPCVVKCASMAGRSVGDCDARWVHQQWGCESPAEPGTGIGTAQCSLFPYVKTYTAVVNGGRWTESLVSVSAWRDIGIDTSDGMVNVKCLKPQDRGVVLDAGVDLMGRSWIPYYGPYGDWREVDSDLKSTRVLFPRTRIYWFGPTSEDNLNAFLATYLRGTIRPHGHEGILEGPAQLQAIYNNGNITFDRLKKTWENLSESITIHVRQHSMGTFSASVTGQAFRDQTCVHIRWPFLAYPTFLVLFAIVFFICMIFETRRIGTSRHNWKSSPLPLLFHGLEREALQTVQSAELVRAEQMEKAAKRTSVRLSQTEGGWQFVGTHNASLEE